MGEKKEPAKNLSQFNRFLDNNQDFLQTKYEQFYKEPPALGALANEGHLHIALTFIYDIFSFNKYKNDTKMNATLQKSLTTNINDFIKSELRKGRSQDDTFSGEMSVTLLKYCIENNDMFAVHYDKKNPKPQPKPAEDDKKSEKPEEEESMRNESGLSIEPSAKMEYSQVAGEPAVADQNPGEHPQQSPVEPREPSPEARQREQKEAVEEKLGEEVGFVNEFGDSRVVTRAENMEVISRQLKAVYEYYCKQQQIVGPASTFDNINHKCQSMDIGKFLTFGKAVGILHVKDKAYSEGKLEKKLMMVVFKKHAKGKREIGFPTFQEMMAELRQHDEHLYKRMGLGEEGAKGQKQLLERLKSISLPFSTKDPQGREATPLRNFVPKLTTHSGKVEEALREDLILRKEKTRFHQPFYDGRSSGFRREANDGGRKDSEDEMTLKLGKQTGQIGDAGLLSKLIVQDEQDEVFLKDYHLPVRRSHHDRPPVRSFDHGPRYPPPDTEPPIQKNFSKQAGGFTSRPSRRQQVVLPRLPAKARGSVADSRSFRGRKTPYGL